jgi:hypothetical protein
MGVFSPPSGGGGNGKTYISCREWCLIMEDRELREAVRRRYNQILTNVKSRSILTYAFFLVVIPVLLFGIFLLPQAIKDNFLIFNTAFPLNLQTYLLNEYTHSVFTHFSGNVLFYLVMMLAIFCFEDNRKRFWTMMALAFIVVPVIASLLTVGFWYLLGRTTASQGFSGINAALVAYALMVFIMWLYHDFLSYFEHPDLSTGRKKIKYYIIIGLLSFVFGIVCLYGLQQGFFIDMGTSVSNGIAHFGGFVTGAIGFLLFDLFIERRNQVFDALFLIAIIAVVFFYIPYLVRTINAVKLT